MKRTRLPEASTLALWPLVEAYAEHLRERGCKPRSVRNVCAALHRFCAFAHERGRRNLAEVTALDLEGYSLSLAGMTVSSQQFYLVNARLLFRWLEKTQRLFLNPAARLCIPRRPKTLLPVPTEKQVARLLAAPNTRTPYGVRDRAWLEVAYATGARRIEMTRLAVADVDLSHGVLRLFGKGDKERLVPLGREAHHWLEIYLRKARPKLLKGRTETALWLSSRNGKPLGYEAVQQQLRRYARQLGLPVSLLTAHNLRRACATHMLRHGASPLMLKELLGHTRTATLSHYLRQSIADLKETHRRSAPGR